MTTMQNLMSILAIAAGIFCIFAALDKLIVRFFFLLLAFWLINYGLRTQGLPPLQVYLWMWWNSLNM